MTDTRDRLEQFAVPLPITHQALNLAERFSSLHPTPQKAEQVRLNTLAVCVMHDYLQLMGISTDLSVGDSWNPVVQLCANVADLDITGLGRLECRAIASTITSLEIATCLFPPEVWDNRIGYVVVQLNEPLQEANLLGFVESTKVEEMPLDQLRSPEALLEHLDRLLHPAPQASVISNPLVNLSRWMEGVIETGWQTIESLLNESEIALDYGFRTTEVTPHPVSSIGLARPLNLGEQVTTPVALVVNLSPEPNQSMDIKIRLYPLRGKIYLPSDLDLAVLDASGATFLSAQSRSIDNFIQLQFSGQVGEQFSVQVTCRSTNVSEIESFII